MPGRNRRGIALPVTLFIVTLLTITLAAAFARVAADREIAVGADKAVSALTVAQSGLQRYLAYRTTRPPDGDSLRFNVIGGYADVVARVVRQPDTTRVTYILRSTGNVIVPALGGVTQAKRTVAQFATWGVVPMRRIAAYVAANGAQDGGGTMHVYGTDACGASAAIGSVRASTGSKLNRGGAVYTPAVVIAGAPVTVADTTGVDWTSILNGAFVPDYQFNGNYTFTTADANYASRLVKGNATISNVTGTGILIVTGDLTTSGTAGWRGIVLVGGSITLGNSVNHFYGLVISGLGGSPYKDTRLGGPGAEQDLFDYSSCDVNRALADVRGLVAIKNAWVDNWSSY